MFQFVGVNVSVVIDTEASSDAFEIVILFPNDPGLFGWLTIISTLPDGSAVAQH